MSQCENSNLLLILIIVIIIIAFFVYYNSTHSSNLQQNNFENISNNNKNSQLLSQSLSQKNIKNTKLNHQNKKLLKTSININDYDYNNLNNPLTFPTSRPSEQNYNDLMNTSFFMNPIKNSPDKPTYIGNLVESQLSDIPNHIQKPLMPVLPITQMTPMTPITPIISPTITPTIMPSPIPNIYPPYIPPPIPLAIQNKILNENPQLPSVLQLIAQRQYTKNDKYDYYVLLPSSGNNPPIKYSIKTHRNQEIYDGDIIYVLGKEYIFKQNKNIFDNL